MSSFTASWMAAIRHPKAAQRISSRSSEKLRELGIGRIASVSGRYYAMDRDKRWDRIERAFGAMVLGDGAKFQSAAGAVRSSYERGITDEFIEPFTIVDAQNQPIGLIRDDDSVIMYNYRADRAREITLALTDFSLEKAIALARPEESHLHDDDPVRQELRASLRRAA